MGKLASVVASAGNDDISLGDGRANVLVKGWLHKPRVLLDHTKKVALAERDVPIN